MTNPDPDAFFRRHGEEIVFRPNATSERAKWRQRLITNAHGAPVACEANIALVLQHHPSWTDVLWFNEFSSRPVLRRPAPWERNRDWPDRELSDADATEAAIWMQRETGLMVSPPRTLAVMVAAARVRPYHPVRDYLSSLRWDRTPRISSWLSTYLGVGDTVYHRAVGARWLIGAVARVFQPGCKLDTALILEGRQGLKKSTAAAVLAGAWFTDQLPDLSRKDALEQLQGVWIVELAELDALSRSEASRIKAFMSSSCDRFRPSYGRHAQDFRRQCAFVGTLNPEGGYLKDPTGARRFWVVRCGDATDIDALRRDRDQLWAEAVHRFRAGEPWWLDTPDLEAAAAEAQDERYAEDAREALIAAWAEQNARVAADGTRSVSVSEVLEHGLNITDRSRWGQREQNLVTRCLVAMRWVRRKVGPRHNREWRYFAPAKRP